MRRHECVVIGDSLAAVHLALELAESDIHVLLVRPDVMPVEVHETSFGAFDCDIASVCDLQYYRGDDRTSNLYGFGDEFITLPYPYRLRQGGYELDEPGDEANFLKETSRRFPGYDSQLIAYNDKIHFLHDVLDEIETITGLTPPFLPKNVPLLSVHLFPWTFRTILRLNKTRFGGYLAGLNLPAQLNQLYELICFDHLGLGLDSIDVLSGVEIISRRLHGLSYPDGGLVALKDTMFERLRQNKNVQIIGGKNIDLIKSSAGIVYEVFIDERDKHSIDWVILDESIGLLGFEGAFGAQGKFSPLGYYSNTHVDFKLFVAWNSDLPKKWPVGVNFVYNDTKFPPQAPHMIRIDVMPSDIKDPYGIKAKLTVRGKYPVEGLISSWGKKVNQDDLQAELMSTLNNSLTLPEGPPAFAQLVLPRNVNDPFSGDFEQALRFTPSEFASQHYNARVIQNSEICGGNIRLAFRSAERIAKEIKRKLKVKKFLHDFAVKPVQLNANFSDIVSGKPER